MHKYESLMSLLAQLQCPHVAQLTHGKNATYTSDVTANDMLDSIATVIRNEIDNKLLKSPFVSLFIDESTDIAVHKKLAIYGRVLCRSYISSNGCTVHHIKTLLGFPEEGS